MDDRLTAGLPVDDRVRPLLVFENPQMAVDALGLEGVDFGSEIGKGVGALGGHHGYHSTADYGAGDRPG